jgi:NAD(P)-dependent dehydrogenase (short-subunit alcohol dehydrogenase family)
MASLTNRVAVVAGATRGAGRGIARGLAEAGAFVYCTGRSVAGQPSAYGRPETIDETADIIERAGGTAVAVRVDHTDENAVEALFNRVVAERGRLDIVVDSVAGEDPMMAQGGSFWDTDLKNGEALFRQAILTRVITAKHAARHMVRSRAGFIVEVTENDTLFASGNPLTQIVKFALKGMTVHLAAELKSYGVAAIAITPGFLRSESMLQEFGVSEQNWRDGGKTDSNFLESESPLFIGRAVAALAADPNLMARSGQLCSSWEIGRELGLTDYDGRRPDWGASAIDFSVLPPALVDLFRDMTDMHLRWLRTLAERTADFRRKIPEP